jgi:hypothetical protein
MPIKSTNIFIRPPKNKNIIFIEAINPEQINNSKEDLIPKSI